MSPSMNKGRVKENTKQLRACTCAECYVTNIWVVWLEGLESALHFFFFWLEMTMKLYDTAVRILEKERGGGRKEGGGGRKEGVGGRGG